MDENSRRLYNALTARDARFDGVFFVGVTSTGIYCRPICPAKTPKPANCRFFDSPQQAEHAGFRPCLRCRPELAPGNAPVDDGQRIAQLIVQRLEEGTLDETAGLEAIAAQFELSSRQIRRIIQKTLGVPPIQLLLTRRLLLAKQILTETRLPITEVAFASGFSSLRRFNDAFNRRYGMPPTRLRAKGTADAGAEAITESQTSTLQVSYRPPYDWTGVLAFLGARALAGVEHVTDSSYARTVRLGTAQGWIRVTQSKTKDALLVEFTHSLTPALPALLSRVRALFDLDARPDVIARRLRKDARLASAVKANPGLRTPGAFHGFELGLRAILGQQVTVKAATTIAGRVAGAFGEPLVTPFAELNRITPAPAPLAAASIDELARHGIVAARARSIIALAGAQEARKICLDNGAHHNPDDFIERLRALPGVGPWTAQYIAMRALRWPDAFPKEDLAVRTRLGGVTAKEAEALSQSWRPWRSYAVMHIWGMAKPRKSAQNTSVSKSIRRLGAAYLLVLLACAVWPPRPHAETRQELADGRGRDVAARLCAGACHAADKIAENPASKQEWLQIVDDMKNRGAAGTEDQFKIVVSYLTAHYGKTVKINDAAAKELDATLDLGPGQADAIVAYRNGHGRFAEWKDLLRVPGLDPEQLQEQKQNVVF